MFVHVDAILFAHFGHYLCRIFRPASRSLIVRHRHGWNTRRSDIGYNVANLPNSLRFVGQALSQKKAVKGLSGLLGGPGKDKGKDDGK